MGGHMQQSSAAVYDHTGGFGEAGDAAMSRWLQSAGLQHLASNGLDQRFLPNLLAQGYGAQSLEEKQKVFRMLRSMNMGNENGLDTLTPPLANTDGFLSPEMRGDFGAGLLDLHAVDDNELLSEHTLAESFETSPFMPINERGFENSFDAGSSSGKQLMGQMDINSLRSSATDREVNGKEGNLAKIRVVVRKRPLNKKELARKEDDIVTIDSKACSLTVHETKLKVDLTAYVEKSEFTFDSVLDSYVTNEEVYRCTVEPIIPILFHRTKATCFAYGQTGSGKTYTMQPLPLKASEDILGRMNQPVYRNQGFHLWLSFFEIYGGKLFDLLSDRRKLCMREDGRQQVCIVGLQEFEVSDVQVVRDYIEKGNASRSTGSTGANEESSRSHAILQLVIKKHSSGNEMKGAKTVGKMSFIDLAGSERGADTTDNDRQTRMEGAEINKSLLALKECIRALDNDQIHIPFRGSKLTEVLRDSFVGDSRTVMISCISPNAGSCEHTLNTLRYADRVKGLSKSNNKKDQTVSNLAPPQKDSPPSAPVASVESSDYNQESSAAYNIRKTVEIPSFYGHNGDLDAHSSNLVSNYSLNTRTETGMTSNSLEKDKTNLREKFSGSQKLSLVGVKSNDMHDVLSPTSRKISREQKPEKQMYWQSKEDVKPDASYVVYSRQQSYTDESASNAASLRPKETEYDGHINAILEQEEALVAAHRKEIEDTMELVREEMKLITEVDQPGSRIDRYVSQLSSVLSRKATGLVNLQACLARFQQKMKEHEIFSRREMH
ncbi:kinesin-like protein KIN-13A [Cryptomeria japonica]|uniref:kinesin-like protein KIN-13A n=1 Tax=Cryptomeria japonica TaxID=3369 RepID=UPI0027DA37CC|nr:kinesin-like protein KIN-13A [Cryptomeria japonica]